MADAAEDAGAVGHDQRHRLGRVVHIAGRAEPHGRRIAQHHAVELRIGAVRDDHVDLAALERGHEVGAAADVDVQLQQRRGARHFGEQQRQHGLGHVVRRADAQVAFERALPQAAQRLVIQRQHVVRIGEQAFALLGQALLAALLGKEGLADLLFEPLHLLRDRRLRAVQMNGRGGKAVVADDGCKRAQQFKIERGHSLILLMCFLRRLDCCVTRPSLQ
ncbi:hypothetical protein D9M68_650860 [compost metagenome]